MQNIFIEFLPPWIETGLQPAFYDKESGTILQQVSRMYAKINELIKNNNDLNTEFIELKNYVDYYFDSTDFQAMVDAKLDEMATDGTLADLINQEIFGELNAEVEKKLNSYKITSSSTFAEIKDAFEDPSEKIIDFEKATYTLTDKIDLTPNTTVNLNGSTIQSTYLDQYNDNIVFMGVGTATTTGYNGLHDVTFRNGNINTAFAFMHAENVKIEDITFGNAIKGHVIQIAGCRNFEIRNCIFNGTLISDSGYNHECIQLETANHDAQPYFPSASACYDHSGNDDIRILNNTFRSGDGVVTRNYVSIGHHAEDSDNLYSQYNILIRGNDFQTSQYWDISCPGLNYSVIEDNVFSQSDTVNNHVAISLRGHQKQVTIRNNKIIADSGGIVASSTQQRENLYIYGNKINVVQASDSIGINLRNADGLYIYNNEIKSSNRAIYTYKDGDGTYNRNHYIHDNIFDIRSSSAGGVQMAGADSELIYVANNIVNQQDQTQPFLRLPSSPKLTYSNNVIKNSSGTDSVNAISSIDDYTNVYGVGIALYSGGGTYAQLSSEDLSRNALQFNTIDLVVHATGSTANGMSVIRLKTFTPTAKLDARKYNVMFSNGSNGTLYGQFEINSGGASFNWSSSDDLTLRKVIGYNEELV